MRKLGGAAIHMQQSFSIDILKKIRFLAGTPDLLKSVFDLSALKPFDERVVDFLGDVSKILMSNPLSKKYSDVVTFAFWIRKGSVLKLKERFSEKNTEVYRLGRGVTFHIAPSNVPVNFAYSLVSGLLTGNINIVRVPGKDFEQVSIITEAINQVLTERSELKGYIYLVKYERDKDVNDLLSSLADTRIIWGGDETIASLRLSPLQPRSTEITFADRFSLSVIDSDQYLKIENKESVALDFYNDTYFSDQNACTSPRIVIWTGSEKVKAKDLFWKNLHELVKRKYAFQDIQSVNKLTSVYKVFAAFKGARIVRCEDNLITRVLLDSIPEGLMDYRENSGFFFEYDCDNIMDIRSLCDDKRCQTIGLLGDSNILGPLLRSGIKGVDRVVPMGHTMEFDLIWDGYDLYSSLTRIIDGVFVK